MQFRTEYEFTLPRGYVDRDGNLHRQGVMRLATARDEIAPLTDMRVQRNKAYLIVVLLSRVVTRLGDLPEVNTGIVEGLYAADLRYLEELYNRVNGDGSQVQVDVHCPECGARFQKEFGRAGES